VELNHSQSTSYILRDTDLIKANQIVPSCSTLIALVFHHQMYDNVTCSCFLPIMIRTQLLRE